MLCSVEKGRPHYDLGTIKTTFCDVKALRITTTALRCARALNMTLNDVVDGIQGITREHFYKSMTALANSAIWQDVYHVPFRGVVLYVKFTTDVDGSWSSRSRNAETCRNELKLNLVPNVGASCASRSAQTCLRTKATSA
jgi:motility quorum-sensing regulator/GCU-specific mRNA interferase toxin